MTEETPLMRKIRLLMAKAQGTNNEHEATAFAEKVQELLLQNGLSASDINMEAGQAPREEVQQHDQERGGKDFLKSPARRVLLSAVCEFYMCSYLRWGSDRVVIIGKKSNAEVAAAMMNYLLDTVIRLSNSYARGQTSAVRIDFRRGCMARLADRLHTLSLERKRAAQQPTGNTLPALFVDESRLVAAYLATLKTKRAKPIRITQGMHAQAGRRAAEGISLNPQVGQGGGHRRIGGK
jgi:hypothetical protein